MATSHDASTSNAPAPDPLDAAARASAHPALAAALTARGFEALTPVQRAVLDPDVAGIDLIVSAQTGSGKTVAFGLSMAKDILGARPSFAAAAEPLALVVAPTRELALQVQRELAWLYEPAGGRVASCVGGMDMRDERRALDRGAHIVVGTPGRLVDHIRRGSLRLEELKALALDEADEMLNLGFREELEFILEAAPAERRTLMFSATMAKGVEALARTYLRDARRLNTGGAAKAHADIQYRALVTGSHDEENAIFNVIRYYDAVNALVFCGTREAVARLSSRLANRGLQAVALSGELSQKERSQALQAMRDQRAQVCVATDVAARGIDLPELDLVIHADLPKNTEGLLHRSGRTGRAGRKGVSILIVPPKARRRVERLLHEARVQAEWAEPPSADAVRQRDDERLLGHPALMEPAGDIDTRLIDALTSRHEPRQIAAAFVRLARRGLMAPEDLQPAALEAGGAGRPRRGHGDSGHGDSGHGDSGRGDSGRGDAGGGVWVRLSVGRAQSAEPRWLIPLLCKAGGLTKQDLGAIRIAERETMVELSAHAAERLFAALGPDGRLEKSIFAARAAEGPRPRSDARDGAPRGPKRPAARPERPARPKRAKRGE